MSDQTPHQAADELIRAMEQTAWASLELEAVGDPGTAALIARDRDAVETGISVGIVGALIVLRERGYLPSTSNGDT